jgi:hypothetical protein
LAYSFAHRVDGSPRPLSRLTESQELVVGCSYGLVELVSEDTNQLCAALVAVLL